jgi:16S rRNA (guanine966-N2)-methyltransferase
VPDAGRVIAGSARSIRLEAPGPATRPIGDRVKQTLFAILEPELRGARFLDLFAGSGAVGIEALSRGAAHATFVERDALAVKTIRANLERTSLAGADRVLVIQEDALAWLRRRRQPLADAPVFDVVVADPPYDDPALLQRALEALGPHISLGGWVIAKHFWRSAPPAIVALPPPIGGLLASERERRFGETALTFYRRRDADPATEDA